MNLERDIRRQFTLFLFLEKMDQAAELRGHLAVSGYEVFLFKDQETLLERVKEATPHLIIFEIEALQTKLSEFVEKVLETNSEILFLPLVDATQCHALSDYQDLNFVGYVPSGENRDLRLLWEVDLICARLSYQYQNEKMLEKIEAQQKTVEKLELTIKEAEKKNFELAQVEGFQMLPEIEIYKSATSLEEILDLFLKHLEQKFLRKNQRLHVIVLKFLPTVQSFVATQSLGLASDQLRGVGARLEPSESEDLLGFLEKGQFPSQMVQLMQEGLKVPEFVGKALLLPESIEALFVFWVPNEAIRKQDFENEFAVFQLLYRNLSLARKLKISDTKDPITDLENREFYLKKMDEEIARARRLQKAVSVIKISVDHLDEIQQAYGLGTRNTVLKTIATFIKRTGRVNDFACRSEENEIALILPHCGRKGAAIRAERIRRMIENHSFNISGFRVTLSLGISEYPTLCASAEELEKTSEQALEFIQGKGGNKVCLYRARQDFKPDFDAPPI